ncbi:hypothetical protein HELRODRAFT_177421 [Helobdella robusta]|uniref:Actin-modulator n=1 Tax=Helobdella robusta TaxID=6412 RepID=T1FBN7_HELRO|nr:hypothetical protein HELRODRAFT_177421 [Helobdella robusta]ESN98175.1 hypothetical protein HELRODRAFT_177421 [Helobdella robusta]
MPGLLKPKTYDWKDSNVALFGSDLDRKVKKESAETEPAWKNAGQKVGIKIWRIVNFKVTDWPERDYGRFYSGDSYIILNTYKPKPNSNELAYDLHFWIGGQSTQDEYGTAAYKTVELDTYLDDKPVQHREVEGYESELFKSYFKQGFTTMDGGAESGFNHVKPVEYQPRLLHFHGDKTLVSLKEVPIARTSLKSDDVFILDAGLKFYQWNGKGSNKDERFKAAGYMQKLKSERNKSVGETLDEDDISDDHEFYSLLTGDSGSPEYDDMLGGQGNKSKERLLLKVSDESGQLKMEKIKSGQVSMKDFASKDVFIFDTASDVFVWIGRNASKTEKQNGVGYAHNYLMKTDHPLIPVHVIKEGQTNKSFQSAVAA